MDTVDVAVFGLGFTGLPMAAAAAIAGLQVVGLDSSPQRVDDITHVTPGVGLTTVAEDVLRKLLSDGLLHVRDTSASTPRAHTYVVCVSTPSGSDVGADLTALFAAADAVAEKVHRGDLVLIQSTCPPGTVERMVAPRLAVRSGLKPGDDFFLAYSPVRVNPGRESANLTTTPRVVAGLSPACAAAANRFLASLAEDPIPVSTIRAAELVKVFENTFRLVNISLVNELAEICRLSEVDVLEVLDAAGTKPYGFLRHQPSPGAGGDCIPVSAGMFAAAAREHATVASLVETALDINEAMPARTVHLVRLLLAEHRLPPLRGSRVLVVGVTYKPDVASTRRSSAVRVLEQLRRKTAVDYHDPYVPQLALGDGTTLRSRRVEPGVADLMLVLTRHRVLDNSQLVSCGAPVIDCTTGQPRLQVA
jgi:UDP-N-acetyl-D-glucosamine dehydrogenase